jgi:hypothetical protein
MQPRSSELDGVVIFWGHVVAVLQQHHEPEPPLLRSIIAAEAAACAAVCADILMKCMYPISATNPIRPNMGTNANVNMIKI